MFCFMSVEWLGKFLEFSMYVVVFRIYCSSWREDFRFSDSKKMITAITIASFFHFAFCMDIPISRATLSPTKEGVAHLMLHHIDSTNENPQIFLELDIKTHEKETKAVSMQKIHPQDLSTGRMQCHCDFLDDSVKNLRTEFPLKRGLSTVELASKFVKDSKEQAKGKASLLEVDREKRSHQKRDILQYRGLPAKLPKSHNSRKSPAKEHERGFLGSLFSK